ncbi:MAG: glycosyltransferase family 2 protein [Rhodanobacteraceae bacterium]
MTAATPRISVVSPVYGCAGCLRELVARLQAALSSLGETYEIVLVDDASPDGAWPVARELGTTDARVKAVALSRNFGQHHAISAGLDYASGDWVVVLDCDLQDRPEEIARLWAKAQEGHEVVFAEREVRQDGWLKRTLSRGFIALLNWLSGTTYDYRTANFGIYARAVVDAVRSMGDPSPFFPIMVRWTGFRTTSIPVRHDARGDGKSSYTLRKLARLALETVLSHSDKPLRLVAAIGLIVSVIALAITAFSVLRYLHGDVTVAGYTSVIASMWLLAGVMLFCMGIIGLYVGRVFESVKRRPLYVVRERVNL